MDQKWRGTKWGSSEAFAYGTVLAGNPHSDNRWKLPKGFKDSTVFNSSLKSEMFRSSTALLAINGYVTHTYKDPMLCARRGEHVTEQEGNQHRAMAMVFEHSTGRHRGWIIETLFHWYTTVIYDQNDWSIKKLHPGYQTIAMP